eukprot:2430878-Rhodomonas_salina.2
MEVLGSTDSQGTAGAAAVRVEAEAGKQAEEADARDQASCCHGAWRAQVRCLFIMMVMMVMVMVMMWCLGYCSSFPCGGVWLRASPCCTR